MEHPAISVIVPVYNVEKTLDRCINSILNQSFKDYEIILVNDGSTDASGRLCDNYAEEYPFVHVIHKENEGLGPTRNRGVESAVGKYIYHCDSDDWIESDLLKDCYQAAEKEDANIVIFGYTIFTEKEKIEEYQKISVKSAFYETQKDAKELFAQQFTNAFVMQSACNRLIRREFLLNNDIWFQPFRRCQDIIFSLDLFAKAERVCCLEQSYYNYIIEPGVYKGRSFDEMLSIYLDVFSYVNKAFKEWGMWDSDTETKIINLYMAHVANYVGFYVTERSLTPKDDIKKVLKDARVQELFTQEVPIKSRYLKLVKLALHLQSKFALGLVFKLHEKRK